jgi:hypothetical protein
MLSHPVILVRERSPHCSLYIPRATGPLQYTIFLAVLKVFCLSAANLLGEILSPGDKNHSSVAVATALCKLRGLAIFAIKTASSIICEGKNYSNVSCFQPIENFLGSSSDVRMLVSCTHVQTCRHSHHPAGPREVWNI